MRPCTMHIRRVVRSPTMTILAWLLSSGPKEDKGS